MSERSPQAKPSVKDSTIARFNIPQARVIAMQGIIVVLLTTLACFRVVAMGVSVLWLIPLALFLYLLVLSIDVSVEVTSTEIGIRPWLGQLARLSWQRRFPLWALVGIQHLRYGSLRLIFISSGREQRIVLWSLGFPPRHIPALLRAIQTNRASQ
ncbi:MAG TPA: hypothetical protein VH590_10535 [Ktedonobacterales bacterium]|jgi:hypothetical protein